MRQSQPSHSETLTSEASGALYCCVSNSFSLTACVCLTVIRRNVRVDLYVFVLNCIAVRKELGSTACECPTACALQPRVRRQAACACAREFAAGTQTARGPPSPVAALSRAARVITARIREMREERGAERSRAEHVGGALQY